MNLYLLTRKDDYIDYDEYIGGVVAARTTKSAKAIMMDLENQDWVCALIGRAVESQKKEEVILDSFNCG